MSALTTRIQPPRRPVLPNKDTSETRFWRSFKKPLLIKENNAVNHIHFSPANPHDLAFTSATRIQILSARTLQPQKTIAKFKDNVYSGEFRSDGRLLVAGDATGLIQAFDTQTRNILVTLKPTSHPVHVTKFHPTERSTLLSASDDRVVRLWDLTTPDPLVEFGEHNDYVRTAAFVGSSNLIISGCYDGHIRLFDPRQSGGAVANFASDLPIESVLPLSDTTLASSQGPTVKIWDLSAGRCITTLSNFQKTVTCLASAGERGLIAGSLDGHVKVFDVASTSPSVEFGWKYGGPVLACGVSPDQKQLAAGLTTGLISVRTRKTEPRKAEIPKSTKSGNFARMTRGAEYRGELEAQVVAASQKQPVKFKAYEKHIRAFRWGDALDAALQPGISADQTVMVLEELRARGKISVALAGRDDSNIEPLLRWCARAIYHPRVVSIIADWIGVIISEHAAAIDRSRVFESLLRDIHARVRDQIERAKDAQHVEGMLDLLMT